MIPKLLKRAAKAILVLAIFGFFAYYLIKSWHSLPEYAWRFNYSYLAFSGFFLLLSFFLSAVIYYAILKKMGIVLDFRKVAVVRLLCEIGKYMPGKVWVVLGRFYFFRKERISKTEVLVSIIIEMAAMILGGFLMFLLTLFWWEKIPGAYSLAAALLLIPVLLIAMHPKFINLGLRLFAKVARKEIAEVRIRYKDVLETIAVYLGYWLAYGLGVALFIGAAYPVSGGEWIQLIGIHAISWVMGYIALIAPGGIGIREGIMASLLSIIMPVPVAIIFSIATRIWITIIELLVYAVSLIYSRSALRR